MEAALQGGEGVAAFPVLAAGLLTRRSRLAAWRCRAGRGWIAAHRGWLAARRGRIAAYRLRARRRASGLARRGLGAAGRRRATRIAAVIVTVEQIPQTFERMDVEVQAAMAATFATARRAAAAAAATARAGGHDGRSRRGRGRSRIGARQRGRGEHQESNVHDQASIYGVSSARVRGRRRRQPPLQAIHRPPAFPTFFGSSFTQAPIPEARGAEVLSSFFVCPHSGL